MDKVLEKLEALTTSMGEMKSSLEEQKRDLKSLDARTTTIGQKVLNLEANKRWYEEEESPRRQPKPIAILPAKEDVRLQDLPEFDGELDAEIYLDWERRIERMFEHKEWDEETRFSKAILKLTKHAAAVLENIQDQRDLEGKPRIKTWTELKAKLKKRFVPRTYRQELFYKYQTLRQNQRSVRDYIKEFEKLLLACNANDVEEQKIVKFVDGLDLQIRNAVELQTYYTLEEVYGIAIRVERQLNNSKSKAARGYFTPKNEHSKQSDETPSLTQFEGSSSSLNKQNKGGKTGSTGTSIPMKERTCFKCHGTGHIASQCPNRVMISLEEHVALLNKHVAEQKGEHNQPSSHAVNEQSKMTYDEVIEPESDDDQVLVLRQLLHVEECEDETKQQRHNLFKTRCKIEGRSCSIIIDGGSSTNVASQKMVNELKLKPQPHPKPYHIAWISDKEKLLVKEQVLVNFSIGDFESKAWCDILPMNACSLLLGRPWQWDNDALHFCKENSYTVAYGDKRIKLKSLPPRLPSQKTKEPSCAATSYMEQYSSKKQNNKGKRNHHEVDQGMIAHVQGPRFDVGDFVWLDLNAAKLHPKLTNKGKSLEEGPYKVVHREGFNTFQVMLGQEVVSFGKDDLIPCFDNT